ncbi:hypothetical protein G3M83_11135 [Rouxiella badensis]|uniref:hypothetical protein n=1 Tax=Rouxiella badensis TaxID=1646377 RepID=UPI0013EF25ED|nr:hypothetical protein [Rouxiella badensis]QII38211.1 hypothetical protein G3M83_11135 [Rouxiella badensis]
MKILESCDIEMVSGGSINGFITKEYNALKGFAKNPPGTPEQVVGDLEEVIYIL